MTSKTYPGVPEFGLTGSVARDFDISTVCAALVTLSEANGLPLRDDEAEAVDRLTSDLGEPVAAHLARVRANAQQIRATRQARAREVTEFAVASGAPASLARAVEFERILADGACRCTREPGREHSDCIRDATKIMHSRDETTPEVSS